MKVFLLLLLLPAVVKLLPVAADPVEVLRDGTPPEVLRNLEAIRRAMHRDAYHWTPLMRAAAENSHPETITMLLEQGEDPARRSLDDWTALMFAAAFNPEPEVAGVLLDAGMDPDERTRDAWVAAYGAARYTGRIVQIDGLGLAPGERGWTALFFAARYNPEPRVAVRLLEAGADPHLSDEYGRNALDYAREAGNGELAALLGEILTR